MVGFPEHAYQAQDNHSPAANLEQVFNTTSDLVCQFNAEFTLTYLNPAFSARCLVAVGTDIAALHSSAQRQYFQDVVALVLAEQSTWQGELGIIDSMGNEVCCSCVALAHRNQAGQVTSYTCIYRDTREQKKYELAVCCLAVGLWDWDIPHNHLYWSPRFKEMIGLAVDQALSYQDFESRLHPQDKAHTLAQLNAHLQRDQPFVVEYRLRHNHGHYVWIKATGQASWNLRQRPVRMVGTMEDISTRKRAEREHHLLVAKLAASNDLNLAILNSSQHLVITTDLEGKITQFNNAAEQALGYRAADILGRETPALWHEASEVVARAKDLSQELGEDIAPGFEVFVIKARRFGPDSHEWTLIAKNGYRFPVNLTVTCLRNAQGQVYGYLGVLENISERKRVEVEREALIQQLESRNKELDDFAYVASHDLKAPLRVIDNTSAWLMEDLGAQLEGDNLENLEILRNRAQRMEKLLDDLLEYCRIGRSTDERFQDTIPGDILVNDALLLVNQPDAFRIDISPDFAQIKVFRMPLQLIFSNLINNAIKHHGSDSGTVTLGVQHTAEHYLFMVQDDGQGIDLAYHEKIFGLFQTLQSRDKVEGSGMGLAIVKKHVETAGGSIHLDSAAGQGCRFTLRWPKPGLIQGALGQMRKHNN